MQVQLSDKAYTTRSCIDISVSAVHVTSMILSTVDHTCVYLVGFTGGSDDGTSANRCAWSANGIPATLLASNEHVRDELVAESERNVRNVLLDRQQMLCLCGNQEHVLMWAYYADRHRGVAIHLSANVWPIAAGMQVAYTNSYPTTPLSIIKDDRELVRQFVLKKANAWRHEDEYRVVVHDEDRLRLAAEWLSPSTAILPPGAVVGVIVGSLMEDPAVQQVITSVRAAKSAIPVYRAKPRRKRFKLDFERIA
jgi:hypothetical protein